MLYYVHKTHSERLGHFYWFIHEEPDAIKQRHGMGVYFAAVGGYFWSQFLPNLKEMYSGMCTYHLDHISLHIFYVVLH